MAEALATHDDLIMAAVTVSGGQVFKHTGDGVCAVFTLGTHSLRGLARLGHVWQLIGDGLARNFPPLRSFEATRGSLPHHLTSFVGRATECELVADRLREALLGDGRYDALHQQGTAMTVDDIAALLLAEVADF
jgi:hypothetical protein